jgi:glycosyltransferase involved in cell wall biosynthesis
MWNNQTVSVVCSTFREKKSIRSIIDGFFATGVVDEVVITNNNAEAGTDEEVRKTKARLVYEKRQGYGWGYRKALHEARGDLIVMTEMDGTFAPADIKKLLAYSADVDVVFGTRTTSSMIWKGANMGLFLKWGNWAVAKMIEFLFGTTHLSDVGCSMRLIKRKALKKIEPQFSVGKSHFGLEMMLLTVTNKLPFVEVPVNYRSRVGKSQVTGSFWKTLVLGFTMIFFILKHRLKALVSK